MASRIVALVINAYFADVSTAQYKRDRLAVGRESLRIIQHPDRTLETLASRRAIVSRSESARNVRAQLMRDSARSEVSHLIEIRVSLVGTIMVRHILRRRLTSKDHSKLERSSAPHAAIPPPQVECARV